ncbi:TlpA disulfide reductase family protein [Ramlibacter monticola]|uniref:TlpA family protein disulfide reductase n=1 Tax=Ramlibacter monticola TaxID=1926872 RepID=A0A936YYN0_9BURK|nr:TlpA disulfide reductase family protein [Ramlibacter monticola]MBL0390936.1 TlpA family protein disulfide reductase [Ramlibacter monticola]
MDEAVKPAGSPASGRRGLIVGVGTAAVLAGAGYAWWRTKQKPAGGGAPTIDQSGVQQFWPLEFETPQGTKLAMASLKGKPLILNFWATWCAPCIEEMPMLDSFYRQNSAKGWQVLGLAIDQPSSVRKFLEKTPVSFPIGLAGFGGTDLTKQLGNMAGGLPFSVLFDPDGRVRQRKMGKLSEADLQAWVGSA